MIEPYKTATTAHEVPSLGSIARVMIPSTIVLTLVTGVVLGCVWLFSPGKGRVSDSLPTRTVAISDTARDINDLVLRT